VAQDRWQRVSARAYALWEADDRRHGNDQAHWSQAEMEISLEPRSAEASGIFPWARVVPEDIADFDFEAPIAGSTTADCGELSDLYRAVSQSQSADGGEDDSPSERVWSMLWALTGMHFKPADFNEPFGPMRVLADGSRSAIPSDFRDHIDMLEIMARTASNVVLKARLCDLTWLLDRKRYELGVAAINAYVNLVRMSECGNLKFRLGTDDTPFHHEVHEYLLRALTIARTLGWDKPQFDSLRQLLIKIRTGAVNLRAPVPVHWFCSLDLQMRVSEPVDLAADLEMVLANLPAGTDHHIIIDLWRLAARAYQIAKRNDDMHRCQTMAAEAMVAMADGNTSAMLAAQFIGNAIAALHGVPGAKARRLALRHRLIDVQAGISDEMTTFSQEIDLSELVERTRDAVTPLSLIDSLFVFAALSDSPQSEQLQTEAVEVIRKHPLSSLFAAAHLDNEGKVIHRTGGAGALGEPDASAVRRQVAQAESHRRSMVVSGMIDSARRIITTQHYISDDVLATVLYYSPFVPPDLLQTFARGFSRFFQGDFTSALYILTPLLENSLRHLLKGHGHDVTIFDNATQTQEDRTISSLFEQMRTELDAILTRPITEDIDRVFLAKPGPYIRHAVAHGLLFDGSPYGSDAIYGCWLIFRLCLIPLFPHREALGLT
jgi:hypothetical protein